MKNVLTEMETLLVENRVSSLQVFYLDRHYISRSAVTPELLQRAYTHQLTRRLGASSKEVPQLVAAIHTTNVEPVSYIAGVRFGIVLLGYKNQTLFEYYTNESGDAALIQNHPYQIIGGLPSWTKHVVQTCFNTCLY